jgi:hemerythrin
MPFITWNDKLSTDIEEIDSDHKKIVGMINDLYDGIAAGHGKEVIAGVLETLVSYTRFHFAHEERLFAMTSYADAEAHKVEHEQMTAWVIKTKQAFDSEALPAPSLQVMVYLKDWLFEHIMGSDQKYAPHLKAMGIR